MIKEGANAGTYYPSGSTENVNSISNYGSCSNNCDVLRYSMNGYDSDSDTLRLVDTANPHTVSVDDTFSLQYSEGCCGSSTGDNSGTACADVYFLYSSYDPCGGIECGDMECVEGECVRDCEAL